MVIKYLAIATSGRANYLLKTGAKLKRKKAVPKKYEADMSIISRQLQANYEENKNDDM